MKGANSAGEQHNAIAMLVGGREELGTGCIFIIRRGKGDKRDGAQAKEKGEGGGASVHFCEKKTCFREKTDLAKKGGGGEKKKKMAYRGRGGVTRTG